MQISAFIFYFYVVFPHILQNAFINIYVKTFQTLKDIPVALQSGKFKVRKEVFQQLEEITKKSKYVFCVFTWQYILKISN